jgi:hypothetical protein
MPEPDRFTLASHFALGHKVLNGKFRKFWRSLDACDQDSIAKDIANYFRLANFVEGPPAPTHRVP